MVCMRRGMVVGQGFRVDRGCYFCVIFGLVDGMKMVNEAEFKRRYIGRIVEEYGMDIVEHSEYLVDCAHASWEVYSAEDDADLCPEDWADAEMECWE